MPWNTPQIQAASAAIKNRNITFDVLRLDMIHPVISGNKMFKLKYYIEDAMIQQKDIVTTFGGAYSNHIVATAAMCAQNNLKSIGIIRGEEPATLSHTLIAAQDYGMQLLFVSRSAYKDYTSAQKQFQCNESTYIIPEGGYGLLGVRGASEILPDSIPSYDVICCPVGTGTTLAGLTHSSRGKILGFSVMKKNNELNQKIEQLLSNKGQFEINHDYHFGGYAKMNAALISFMNLFFKLTAIPTDFVYTGKMMYGISDLAHQNYFADGTRILAIHTGGLQGNLSLSQGTLMF